MFVGTVQRIFLYSKKEVVYGWYCLQSWQIWCLKTLCTHKQWGSPTLQTVPELKKLLLLWTGRCEWGSVARQCRSGENWCRRMRRSCRCRSSWPNLRVTCPNHSKQETTRLTVWVRRPSAFIDLEELPKKVASDNCTSSYGHAEDGKGVPDFSRLWTYNIEMTKVCHGLSHGPTSLIRSMFFPWSQLDRLSMFELLPGVIEQQAKVSEKEQNRLSTLETVSWPWQACCRTDELCWIAAIAVLQQCWDGASSPTNFLTLRSCIKSRKQRTGSAYLL